MNREQRLVAYPLMITWSLIIRGVAQATVTRHCSSWAGAKKRKKGGGDVDGKRSKEVLMIRIEYRLETNMNKQEWCARPSQSQDYIIRSLGWPVMWPTWADCPSWSHCDMGISATHIKIWCHWWIGMSHDFDHHGQHHMTVIWGQGC